MLRYTGKGSPKSSPIYDSPLLQSVNQDPHLQNSFALMSSEVLKSLQLSRELPLTLAKQKCKNCERLEHCISGLMSSLLSIEKSISEKQQKMNLILADKVKTINSLELKLENPNDKTAFNHLTSTFFTQAGYKLTNNSPTFPNPFPQPQPQNHSSVTDKKNEKASYVSTYSLQGASQKNRQIKQNKQLYQNIPPNLEKSVKDKFITKLQFENQTLKNYNSSLLAQIQKLKKGKGKNVCSFL